MKPISYSASRLLFICLCLGNLAYAQQPAPDKIEAIERLFAEYRGKPGAAIGVYQNGEVVYTKGYGLANLDYNIPITTKTVFETGLASTTFTAGVIILLENQGKLDLYDPKNYLKRCYEHFRMVGSAKVHNDPELRKRLANQHKTDVNFKGLIFLLKMIWRQGIKRSTRFVFWSYLWDMWKHNRGGIGNFLSFAAFAEHFLPYRKMVKKEIMEQLKRRQDAGADIIKPDIELVEAKAEEVKWHQAS